MEEMKFLAMTNFEAASREALFDSVTDELIRLGFVHPTFRQAVKERESVYPTGIRTTEFGVAIPHVDVEHVIRNGICTVTLKKPVLFGMMGGEPSDSIEVTCLFIILLNARDAHIKLLVRFMNVLQNAEDLRKIQRAENGAEIEKVLRKYIE